MSIYRHVRRGRYPGLGDVYFRSKAEAAVALTLKAMGLVYQHEPREFLFPVARGTVSYRPDFRVLVDGTWRWLEVKGYWPARAKTQLRRFAKYYPEEARGMIIVTDWKGAREWIDRNMGAVAATVEVWPFRKLGKLIGGALTYDR